MNSRASFFAWRLPSSMWNSQCSMHSRRGRRTLNSITRELSGGAGSLEGGWPAGLKGKCRTDLELPELTEGSRDVVRGHRTAEDAKVRLFRWTGKREEAALLVAQDC